MAKKPKYKCAILSIGATVIYEDYGETWKLVHQIATKPQPGPNGEGGVAISFTPFAFQADSEMLEEINPDYVIAKYTPTKDLIELFDMFLERMRQQATGIVKPTPGQIVEIAGKKGKTH